MYQITTFTYQRYYMLSNAHLISRSMRLSVHISCESRDCAIVVAYVYQKKSLDEHSLVEIDIFWFIISIIMKDVLESYILLCISSSLFRFRWVTLSSTQLFRLTRFPNHVAWSLIILLFLLAVMVLFMFILMSTSFNFWLNLFDV